MENIFADTFQVMLGAVGRIFLIILASGLLVYKKVITQDQIKAMSKITVNILLPCMFLSKISTHFDPVEYSFWWILPLTSFAMIFVASVIGYLFYIKKSSEKQYLIPLAGMQNAVYLVLPIGKFMYPNQFDEFVIYNFLFLIGFQPIVWSFGKVMVTGGSLRKVKLTEFLTTPVITALVSLVIVFTGLNRFIPSLVMDSVDLVGSATIPVSNLVLGATLGSISLKHFPPIWDVLKITSIKFIWIPILTILILTAFNVRETHPLLANLMVIESAAAPATALILQIRAYGGDRQTVGSLMFISYIICLFAIPFWISIWEIL